MADTSEPKFLPAFVQKMEKEGLPRIVIDTFAYYYEKVVTGETGMIPDREIESLAPKDVEQRENLDGFTAAGEEALSRTVMIVLNVEDRVVGIVVDSVSDVMTLTPDQIKPAPELGVTMSSDFLSGLGSLENRMLVLVDIDKLLTSKEMALVEQVAE